MADVAALKQLLGVHPDFPKKVCRPRAGSVACY